MAASTSTTGTILSGLASGINWTALINSMGAAEAAPETAWNTQITTLNSENTAYQTLGTDLSAVQSDIATLSDPSFFQSSAASSSNSGVATATAAAGTTLGDYDVSVSQLATAASLTGPAVTAQPISPTDNVNSVELGSSSFASPISAGTFTVNGQTITVSDTDTLQSVFDQINTATGDAVTGSYDSTSDTIKLQSSNPIVLGSAADTSNFLGATGLFNNGSGTIASANRLGAINIYGNANTSDLSTAITDGGSGNGSFTINGVSISYDASTDSINDILDNINSSAAGVTASYDSVNHQFSLANNTTGDVGVTLADNTGNFLTATGLAGATMTQGANLQYSINGSGTLTSQSNTIDGASIGIAGLSVTAQDTGSATITVGADTSTIATAITNFVNDYNTAQKYISSQTATTTDSSGDTVPGLLTGNFDVEEISSQLRQMATATPGGVTGSVQSLSDLGITSNGQDNTLAIDSTTLNQALSSNLTGAQQLFTDPSSGVASQLNPYLLNTIGGNGPLINGEASFTSQVTSLNNSITQLQSKITMDEATMQNEFVEMEDAINQSNTDKEYLTAYFSSSSASAAPAASSIGSSPSSSSSSASSSSSGA
jgi:flagellar hook-associated protein 2